MSLVVIPISIGELADKMTILEIKVEKSDGPQKQNMQKELVLLIEAAKDLAFHDDKTFIDLKDALKKVNRELWAIEDSLRAREKSKIFDQDFIDLARSVYQKNDQRSKLKRHMNDFFDSTIVEEKLYERY